VFEEHLHLLRCPKCRGALAIGDVARREGSAIVDGSLVCGGCARSYPIRSRIPTFVESPDYADSFGWQWNRFARLQRDSYNGSGMVRRTILSRTGWSEPDLAGKLLLECGCGSGNDTEVLATLAGTVVAIDLSNAVQAQSPEVLSRGNVLVMQADLREPPLAFGSFDVVYCHRVIQHTPDPRAAFAGMARLVRPGGLFYLHSYSRHWRSLLQFKYWLRPLIRWMPHTWIFRALEVVGPVLHPLVGFLERFPPLRIPTRLLVPFKNHEKTLRDEGAVLTARERYEFSLLVTFDALTPAHDHPNSHHTIEAWFRDEGFESTRTLKRSPVSVVGVMGPARAPSAPAGRAREVLERRLHAVDVIAVDRVDG
jgi:SAM-dependent methyltransferase